MPQMPTVAGAGAGPEPKPDAQNTIQVSEMGDRNPNTWAISLLWQEDGVKNQS